MEFVANVYRWGHPIQYSYIEGPLRLWDTQTRFARVPFAVEAPSATFLLPPKLPASVAFLRHAAGLSSTGDPALDALLPFPERVEIPPATVNAIRETIERRGRIIAVGTTVARALEGRTSMEGNLPQAGPAVTSLRMGEHHRRKIVDAILTGVHAPDTSHGSLLRAFLSRQSLEVAYAESIQHGLLTHEFGDGWLVLAPLQRRLPLSAGRAT